MREDIFRWWVRGNGVGFVGVGDVLVGRYGRECL